jgi:hypothetical protein
MKEPVMTVCKAVALTTAFFLALIFQAPASFGQAAPAQGAKPAVAAPGQSADKALALKKEMSELVAKIKKTNNSMVEYIMQFRQKGSLPPAMQGDLANMSKEMSAYLKRLDQIVADPAHGAIASKQDVQVMQKRMAAFKKAAEQTIKDAQPVIAGKK